VAAEPPCADGNHFLSKFQGRVSESWEYMDRAKAQEKRKILGGKQSTNGGERVNAGREDRTRKDWEVPPSSMYLMPHSSPAPLSPE
jgi:hypothetical protein